MEIKQLRLGSILLPSNVLAAPLAGYTCYPFRILCSELGAGLCFTEMVSCNALKYQDKATERLLFTTPEEKIKAAQILGANARIMEKMVRSEYFSEYDIIDINMGCPVPNVFKSGEGSALLANPKKAADIIKSCKKSGKVITVKCRIGIKEESLVAAEFAKICEDAGADMITIHGRTRDMMYNGTPYYDQIEQAKSAVQIPVIANGGIFSVEDAEKMMKNTGADGVMIARYALENPFIFSELTKREIKKSKCEILLEQIAMTSRYYDETFTLSYIKKIASYCMKKRKGTKKYKLLLHQAGNIEELRDMIKKIFEG
ncbi:MAG: tRNA-dihydrouridine synthase family protein [Lachnospiraceae bacterium]|nr:tRNA-dihydrouridine synthase family protein [Lachnospiraceae bacterium]